MRRRPVTPLVFIVLVALVALGAVFAQRHHPALGLDLQGGVSVVLQPTKDVSDDALDQTIEIIRNRVDALGVAEPDIARQGSSVIVQLPGVENQQRALELVGDTAELRFRPVLSYIPGTVAGPARRGHEHHHHGGPAAPTQPPPPSPRDGSSTTAAAGRGPVRRPAPPRRSRTTRRPPPRSTTVAPTPPRRPPPPPRRRSSRATSYTPRAGPARPAGGAAGAGRRRQESSPPTSSAPPRPRARSCQTATAELDDRASGRCGSTSRAATPSSSSTASPPVCNAQQARPVPHRPAGHRPRLRGRVGARRSPSRQLRARPDRDLRQLHAVGGQGPGPGPALRLPAGEPRAADRADGVGHPRRGLAAGRPGRRPRSASPSCASTCSSTTGPSAWSWCWASAVWSAPELLDHLPGSARRRAWR